jgi:hypothetical protein
MCEFCGYGRYDDRVCTDSIYQDGDQGPFDDEGE